MSTLQIQTAATINAITSVNGITAALRNLEHAPASSVAWRRKLAHDELYRIANSLTPYGVVCRYGQAPGRNGTLDIYFCSPFALLSLATTRSQMFFNLLKYLTDSTPGAMLDIAFYLDKAVPGNQNRPDVGRSMQCVYWTIVQLPSWFLSRRNGWIPFCYVAVKDQKDFELSDSVLVRFLIRSFGVSSDRLSFTNGFSLQGPNGDTLIVKVNRFVCIADGEQHSKTFSLKGHSGTIYL